MRRATPGVAALLCLAALGRPWPAAAWAGPGASDLQRALQALGVRAADRGAGLEAHPPGPSVAVALCSSAYPEPTRLSGAEAEALERFVAEGGRVYLEFAAREDGKPLFGVVTGPEARRALHQRLVVTGELHPISGLAAGDLLEEHNSACLVPTALPKGARKACQRQCQGSTSTRWRRWHRARSTWRG